MNTRVILDGRGMSSHGVTARLQWPALTLALLFRFTGPTVLLACLIAASLAYAETRTGEVEGYRYRLVVPEAGTVAQEKPLLVVLHGCKQAAADIARLSRFDALAANSGFAVLYPETGPSADNPYGCWRWWAPENQVRKGGEAEIIVTMVSEAAAGARVDRQRVYVVGLSSGGAMSAILGALYPDVFAAVGVHSGMPYAAASTDSCALRALSDGAIKSEARAAVAYYAQGRRHRVMPLMVIQGDKDDVVAPENADRLIRQFAQLNDLADDGDGGNQSVDAVEDWTREDQVTDGRRYRTRGYADARGKEVMRDIRVAGMEHAWSGGPPGEAFSDPKGPDAASLFWQFFQSRSLTDPPQSTRAAATCTERFGTNFSHYWWYARMSEEEYRCDPWRWTWRRGYEGLWTEGRCP